jgi:3-oxoacyl-[acyl-carrier protein] reductase
MKLQDQVAIVTGSSSGIGRATAIALAREGAHLVINYSRSRSESDAQEVASAVEELGRQALLVRADVSDDLQVRSMVDRTVESFGRLDILVNNAGTTARVPFADLDGLTDEAWDRIFAVNVKGALYCSRAAAKVMLNRQAGCIVNVASDSGLRPVGSSIPYCASKAAAISLTTTLAVALAPHIRVNAVAPAMVDTPWHAGKPDWRPGVVQSTLLRRYGRPEDVAEVIVSLASSAGFVTGQTILIDGGLMSLD